jgi:predicted glycosyltransferase involved in capsule biosynthesis
MKLTVGMSTYDDYDGLFFSIQALRMYQLDFLKDNYEIIVIDNNPDSLHGKEVKSFVENWVKGKYIPYTEKKSTSSRNEIFKHAQGEYTLCLDSHVLFEQNGIKNLMYYYEKNPNTKNLIQGPLWYDDLANISTHFDPVWRDIMYGIWATNKEAYDKGEPFEIPMMGLGMFSCKTSEWQGFNEKFKGFGGEEGYIHEKFRRAGGKCICLPNLRWNHRFGRPNGVPYPNILEDRIWNYFVGWLEILKDPADPFFQTIIDAFKTKVPEPVINQIFEKAQTS